MEFKVLFSPLHFVLAACLSQRVSVCVRVHVSVKIAEEKRSLYERLGTKKINSYLQTPVRMDTS